MRRTWAPRGKTPVLPSWGRHRDKVSVIAALSVAPTLRRLGLYWLADSKNYVTAETVVKFLRALLKHLRGRVIVVWDGGSNHKGPLIRAFCARHPRLHLERLPAYAPDHNPVEFVWSHLKYARHAQLRARELVAPRPDHPPRTRRRVSKSGPAQSPVARLQAALPTVHLYLTEDQ